MKGARGGIQAVLGAQQKKTVRINEPVSSRAHLYRQSRNMVMADPPMSARSNQVHHAAPPEEVELTEPVIEVEENQR